MIVVSTRGFLQSISNWDQKGTKSVRSLLTIMFDSLYTVHLCHLLCSAKRTFYRKNKDTVVKRKDCCYKYPFIPGTETIDPRAVLWLASDKHCKDDPTEGGSCKMCPTCILFPALQKLYNVCSHASMIQVRRSNKDDENDKMREKKDIAFAKVAFTPEILDQMPGKSYFRETSIMDDHQQLSGKMKVLDRCLVQYAKQRDRVLLFSYSTATLDFIEQFIKERGYTHLRLDGSTPTKQRQPLIDKFQRQKSVFLFLISTKAGGLGLNLTSANRVIIFDVNCK